MKRKWIAFLSIIIIILSPLLGSVQAKATTTGATESGAWPSGPGVNAESAIVMEASTGLILYEKNINEVRYPASITKIMTVLLAIENSNLGDIVTISDNVVYDVEVGSSRLGVDIGEQLTMQQCLYSILLVSANDIAYAVAEHISGSIDNFAELMNKRAKELGCQNTHFVNPHGLPDEDHYTSAYDMALITKKAMEYEAFRKIFASRTYQIPPTNMQSETRYLANHHDFVLKDEYRYDDCIGGKTGFTSVAKYTLVSVAKRNGLELICVVMKDSSNEFQYTDTKKLFDFAFDNFSVYPIVDQETTQSLYESPFFTRYNSLLSKSDSPITTDENGYLVLPNTASFEDAKREVSFYPEDSSASEDSNTLDTASETGSKDKVIGKISYTYNGKYVGGTDILYNSVNAPALAVTAPESNNPTSAPGAAPSAKSGGSLRPIIIGGIVGLIVLIVGLYYVLVERPRLRRRNAYYKKRALRKSYRDDDFLDL